MNLIGRQDRVHRTGPLLCAWVGRASRVQGGLVPGSRGRDLEGLVGWRHLSPLGEPPEEEESDETGEDARSVWDLARTATHTRTHTEYKAMTINDDHYTHIQYSMYSIEWRTNK